MRSSTPLGLDTNWTPPEIRDCGRWLRGERSPPDYTSFLGRSSFPLPQPTQQVPTSTYPRHSESLDSEERSSHLSQEFHAQKLEGPTAPNTEDSQERLDGPVELQRGNHDEVSNSVEHDSEAPKHPWSKQALQSPYTSWKPSRAFSHCTWSGFSHRVEGGQHRGFTHEEDRLPINTPRLLKSCGRPS